MNESMSGKAQAGGPLTFTDRHGGIEYRPHPPNGVRFLLDRDGNYAAYFPPGTTRERMAVMIRDFLAPAK